MTITEICKEIKKLKSALIFSHNRPDGDTIGAGTALALALESLGIKTSLVCEALIPEKFDFIPKVSSYILTKENKGEFDGHIAVDCSSEMMFGDSFSPFIKGKKTFNIDHHISNGRYANFNYVKNVGACCEIMYEVILELGVAITEDIANCLLLGLVTDTGNFAHNNVTSNTLLVASKLVEKGANLSKINEKMFKSQSKERATIYTKTMSNIRYFLDDKLAFIVIDRKTLKEYNVSDNITEGFIDFPMSIKPVEVAISLLEINDKRYKVSFRSRGQVDVNEIAGLFGGGGHILASGAMLSGYLEDIIDKLTFCVKQRLN